MYPELTAFQITAVAVAAGLLCLGAQFLEWRRYRKRHDPEQHDPNRVAAEIRAGTPIWRIRDKLDAKENQ